MILHVNTSDPVSYGIVIARDQGFMRVVQYWIFYILYVIIHLTTV